MNIVVISGNLTRSPELRHTRNNTPVCDFGLAINEKRKRADGGYDEQTHFIEVTCWAGCAEFVAEHLSKGDRATVQGKLYQDRWTDGNGNKRSQVRVKASRVEYGARRSVKADRSADVEHTPDTEHTSQGDHDEDFDIAASKTEGSPIDWDGPEIDPKD